VIPPRVEYSLTDLGREVAAHVEALSGWIENNLYPVLDARRKYAARTSTRTPAAASGRAV
jgi:DNA-binding HxlR family transcriptional regulator